MKRLIVTGLVVASMVSQSMAASNDTQSMYERLADGLHISVSESRQLMMDTRALVKKMPLAKRQRCYQFLTSQEEEIQLHNQALRQRKLFETGIHYSRAVENIRHLREERCVPEQLSTIYEKEIERVHRVLGDF